MPITAIPKDVELRKISAVQKKALDDLLSKQRENTLLETVISATIPLPIVSPTVTWCLCDL